MQLRSLFLRAASAIALTMAASVVHAAPVTFSFSAQITEVAVHDPATGSWSIDKDAALLPEEGLGLGDVYTGTFTYDPAAALAAWSDPAHPTFRAYEHVGPSNGAAFTNLDNSLNFASNAASQPAFLSTAKGEGWSSFRVAVPGDHGATSNKYAAFYFTDQDGTAFADLAVPSQLDFSALDLNYFSLTVHRPGATVFLDGMITALAQVPGGAVPEPAQALLFAAAALAAVTGMRRTRR